MVATFVAGRTPHCCGGISPTADRLPTQRWLQQAQRRLTTPRRCGVFSVRASAEGEGTSSAGGSAEPRQRRSRIPTATEEEKPSSTGTLNAPAPSSPAPKRQRRSRKPVEAQKQDTAPPNRELPKRIAIALGLIAVSRIGVYVRLPGVDVDAFSQSLQSGGLLSYIDALSGGSVSRVGVFSLGIVPLINASIVLQLLSTTFPSLKKLQREEGPQGRARFQLYQKLIALIFATAQSYGALLFVKPYVADFDGSWLAISMATLVAGASIMGYLADQLTDLKLGNGTSILIAANIVSALPSSVGAAISQSASNDGANLSIYAVAFLLTALGVVFVQEAERKIPMNYATRYENAAISEQAYLPFKVNATGVMPVIFATTLLSLPQALARYIPAVAPAAGLLGPMSPFYLPTNVVLIVLFNYLYTFQQLDPKDLADQLKRQGSSVQGIRPGKQTSEFITETLKRMSLLGSGFLGLLAAAPAGVEALTKLQAFRGFAGTSVLIMVGVATDTARRLNAEQAMSKYGEMDKFYEGSKPSEIPDDLNRF